jgi:hypothetical protein
VLVIRRRLDTNEPVISVDTKKKELVGAYKNGGRELRANGDPEDVGISPRRNELQEGSMNDGTTSNAMSPGLLKVAERAKRHPEQRLLALAHLISSTVIRHRGEDRTNVRSDVRSDIRTSDRTLSGRRGHDPRKCYRVFIMGIYVAGERRGVR